MNLRLVRHLFTRLLRGRRLVGMIALASVGGVVAWVSMLGETPADAGRVFREVMATAPAATLSIAMLFLGTAVLRDERDGGTMPFLFISPIGRVRFAFSAWLAAAGACMLVAAIGWLPAWIGSGLTTGSWTLAFPALVLYLVAAIAYSAIFVPLGYLFGRSLLAGLGYVFVWEGIIATFVSGVSASSVWRISVSVYAGIDELPRDALDVLGSLEPGAGGGVITVAVFIAIGVGVLSWAIRRRDAV